MRLIHCQFLAIGDPSLHFIPIRHCVTFNSSSPRLLYSVSNERCLGKTSAVLVYLYWHHAHTLIIGLIPYLWSNEYMKLSSKLSSIWRCKIIFGNILTEKKFGNRESSLTWIIATVKKQVKEETNQPEQPSSVPILRRQTSAKMMGTMQRWSTKTVPYWWISENLQSVIFSVSILVGWNWISYFRCWK